MTPEEEIWQRIQLQLKAVERVKKLVRASKSADGTVAVNVQDMMMLLDYLNIAEWSGG